MEPAPPPPAGACSKPPDVKIYSEGPAVPELSAILGLSKKTDGVVAPQPLHRFFLLLSEPGAGQPRPQRMSAASRRSVIARETASAISRTRCARTGAFTMPEVEPVPSAPR